MRYYPIVFVKLLKAYQTYFIDRNNNRVLTTSTTIVCLFYKIYFVTIVKDKTIMIILHLGCVSRANIMSMRVWISQIWISGGGGGGRIVRFIWATRFQKAKASGLRSLVIVK